MTDQVRVLAIADSDSYVKWGAALLSRAPSEWDRRLVVLENPVLPSSDQLAAALASAGRSIGRPAVVGLEELCARVAKLQPDVVLLSLRGPLVKVVIRAITRSGGRRPVIVSGLPGISVPATRKAVALRAQADLFVVHSKREVREFTELAARMSVPMRFGLATLPFLPPPAGPTTLSGDVIFAAQAKVPRTREDRLALLGWLAESARRHPMRRVVVKVRATHGEQQTHAEAHDYAQLMAVLTPPPPPNLVIEGGAMAAHLAGASGLVTVSSTAAIEAIALGRPVLALDDFGVGARLINTVFIDSGLLGSSEDLIAGRFMHPDATWLDENYFHHPSSDDWASQICELLAERATGEFALKPQLAGLAGGALRRAWDRKRALGEYDRSRIGTVALIVGLPALRMLLLSRRIRRRFRRRPVDEDVLVEQPELVR